MIYFLFYVCYNMSLVLVVLVLNCVCFLIFLIMMRLECVLMSVESLVFVKFFVLCKVVLKVRYKLRECR